MQHLVILLALFSGPHGIETAVTRTMTAQECEASNHVVSTDETTGVRMFVTCETLDTANAKLHDTNCKAVSLDDGLYITYRCEE
jgi:hypothetical protein